MSAPITKENKMFIKFNAVIEYCADKKTGLYLAHASWNDQHVYASGPTLPLLTHNIKQNIIKKGMRYGMFNWNTKSDNIDLSHAHAKWLANLESYAYRHKKNAAYKRRVERLAKEKDFGVKDEVPEQPAQVVQDTQPAQPVPDVQPVQGNDTECFVVKKGNEILVYEAHLVYRGKPLFPGVQP